MDLQEGNHKFKQVWDTNNLNKKDNKDNNNNLNNNINNRDRDKIEVKDYLRIIWVKQIEHQLKFIVLQVVIHKFKWVVMEVNKMIRRLINKEKLEKEEKIQKDQDYNMKIQCNKNHKMRSKEN